MISGWTWMAIAMGGGFGAMARFLVSREMNRWLGSGFPYGTLTVNGAGSWLLGFLAVFMFDKMEVHPAWRLGVSVGFLGAFTTFSTFSYESVMLLMEGHLWKAVQNAGANLILCVGLCYLGMQMARW